MPRSRRAVVHVLCLAVVATLADGCKSARTHHKEADKAALEAIQEKQKQIGKEQPFTIETKPENLRRQLLIDQDLPRSSDASLSSKDLNVPKDWPEKVPPRPSTQPTTLPTLGAEPGASGISETSQTPGERSAEAADTSPATKPTDAANEAAISAVEAYSLAFPPPVRLTLDQALKVGAANSRDYQQRKERIFLDALSLDLERDDFRTIFAGNARGTLINDQGQDPAPPETGVTGTTSLSARRTFSNGTRLLGTVSFDVVKLLTGTKDSSYGMSWDSSVTVPLLRDGGAAVVLEPLTQAERDLTYSLLDFEQYKRDFAVSVASEYFQVLSQYDQIRNAEAAYRRAIASTRRARRQADAGRLTEIQVDQSVSQELRSRDRWISAQANLGRRLDAFKILLGLPPDANVVLDPSELARLTAILSTLVDPQTQAISGAEGKTDVLVTPDVDQPTTTTATGPVRADPAPAPVTPGTTMLDISAIELPPSALQAGGGVGVMEAEAIRLALANRPDLQVANGEVYDAQRRVIVAANALEAGLTLQGNASSGGSRASLGAASAEKGNARLENGVYTGSLLLDLPLERTQERNAYRSALIGVEAAVRSLQAAEDDIKASIRSSIRELLQQREGIAIQARSVAVAQKRVDSTNLFLEAGRAQIRDVLDAQNELVQSQNGLTNSIVSYRLAELRLQRDMGLLEVSYEGLWQEYQPVLAKREIRP